MGLDQDRELLCKEFHELNGGHWHVWEWKNPKGVMFSGLYSCSCRIKTKRKEMYYNPTYHNPADVLEVMKGRDDYRQFILSLSCHKTYDKDCDVMIPIRYLEPDALLKVAVEFLKERKKKMVELEMGETKKVNTNTILNDLKELRSSQDTEGAHAFADAILCKLLTKLGYSQIVEEYNKISKWYAKGMGHDKP